MTINIVHLLIGILVWGLIAWLVHWALGMFKAPEPVRMVVMVILLIVFVVWLLGAIGISTPVLHIGMLDHLTLA